MLLGIVESEERREKFVGIDTIFDDFTSNKEYSESKVESIVFQLLQKEMESLKNSLYEIHSDDKNLLIVIELLGIV